MSVVHNVKLELLRQGPEHNQLLSPITAYLALCGNAPPQLLHVPFEHWRLLQRLGTLRNAQRSQRAIEREVELRELGEPVGAILSQIPGLRSAIDAAESGDLVHLQLSLAALELAMVPFETAIAPDGFPGAQGPLLLHTPLVITREVRRNQRAEVRWDRAPRILFAFAAPGDLLPVPAQEHLEALRRAIAPLVRLSDSPDAETSRQARLAEVGKLIKVLPDATWSSIAEACRSGEYTHVHILAHGVPVEAIGGNRYGVALCGKDDRHAIDPVDGNRLVAAFRGTDASGHERPLPTLVSLATCDSGAVDTVMVAGGSVAHDLHGLGVPWVIASQFPLWMDASIKLTEVLYEGLLAGNDPRRVLREVRRRLHAEVPDTHDWAALVAYATIPFDLEREVAAFRERQLRQQLEVKFSRIDAVVAGRAAAAGERSEDLVAELAAEIRTVIESWASDAASRSADARAEALGMGAASEKRLAIAYQRTHNTASAADAYQRSLQRYERALRAKPSNHWVLTQFLSLSVVPPVALDAAALKAAVARHRVSWTAALAVAQAELMYAQGKDRAWARGTIAELELLGSVYARSFNAKAAEKRIREACREIVEISGAHSFPVASTRRQFQRYRDHWQRPQWQALVDAALQELPPS